MEIFISFNRDIDLERSLYLGSNLPKKNLHYATKDSEFFFLSQHTAPQVPRHHPKRQSSPREHPSSSNLLLLDMTPPMRTGLTHVHQALCNWIEGVLLGVGLTTIKAESSLRFTQVIHCSGVLILAPLFLSRNPEIAAIILLLQRRELRHK